MGIPEAYVLPAAGALAAVAGAVAVGIGARAVRRRSSIKARGEETRTVRPDGAGALLAGDVILHGKAEFPEGLRVRGALTLAEGAHVRGDVTADGSVFVAREARVDGALTAGGDLRLGPRARVGAAAVAGDAVVARDARVERRLACSRLLLAPADAPRGDDRLLPREDEDPDEPEEGRLTGVVA